MTVVHSANYKMVLLVYFNIAYCNSTAWQNEQITLFCIGRINDVKLVSIYHVFWTVYCIVMAKIFHTDLLLIITWINVTQINVKKKQCLY